MAARERAVSRRRVKSWRSAPEAVLPLASTMASWAAVRVRGGGGVEVGGVAADVGGADGGSLAGEADGAGVVEAAEFAAFPLVSGEDLEALGLGDGGLIEAADDAVSAAELALQLIKGGAADEGGGGAGAFGGVDVGVGGLEGGEVGGPEGLPGAGKW